PVSLRVTARELLRTLVIHGSAPASKDADDASVSILHTRRGRRPAGLGWTRLSDHIHRSVAHRRHIERPVEAGDDIRNYPEVLPGHQALAFSFIELVVVIIDPVFQLWSLKAKCRRLVSNLNSNRYPSSRKVRDSPTNR